MKAITLIALVITIVVLIILAAVAINLSLGNNGIFNRAKTAKEQYSNEQNYETDISSTISNKIDSMINGNRENGFSFEQCTITISDEDVLTVSGVNNIVGFSIIKGSKCIDAVKGNSYQIINTSYSDDTIYVIAIDIDAKLYKSNIANFSPKRLYVYHYGNECLDIVGEWKNYSTNGSMGTITKNKDNVYFSGGPQSHLSGLIASNPINVTNYSYFHVIGTYGTYAEGASLSNVASPAISNLYGHTYLSSDHHILDITSLQNNWYPYMYSSNKRSGYIYSMYFSKN